MQIALFTALFLSFVSSSLAYFVRVPDEHKGWRKDGPQPLKWDRVVTDPGSFTALLTNQDRTVLSHDFVIAKYVDGTRLETQIYPPRGGFPTGDHFRVNLVKSENEPNTILAQSNEFTIYR